jgi:hypothetical protein
LRSVRRDQPHLWRSDFFVAPDALICSRDKLILQRLAAAAIELDAQAFKERLQGHPTQILTPAGPHSHLLRLDFFVARNQQVRHAL